ncbi:MAG: hypothetical protein JO307_08270 [Bryobacterales bacterium]|nr:hypothetical protein [Bryobacterales bacterium]MBV9401910.1 hypothetical protein [Bryobacterales bacterium]
MNPAIFLLLNLVLAFYNVGTIWAHEVDIFRSWNLVPRDAFHRVQAVHWGKLPYWVLLPVGLALAGSISLIWYRPANSPVWVWCGLAFQVASHALTALLWGRWQAKLSKDPLGPTSPYLRKILSTHWIRTMLINAYGFTLLIWAIETMARQ